jgi:phospholipid/cholesterol/gamma-HCH transport system substrate-binding protein
MASIKTKFAVGIFVIFGFSIATVAVIWLGMADYLEKGQHYTAYFDESVQGLEKDSPVKYRGVSIGRVESIGVAPDAMLIQVTMKIEKGLKLDLNLEKIVAQLKSVGITGIMFIELDQKLETDPDLSPRLTFKPKFPAIATKPSGITQLIKGIETLVSQLNLMDIGGISSRLKTTLDKINVAVEDARIETMSGKIISSLDKVDGILDNKAWSQIMLSVEKAGGSLQSFAANADRAVKGANKTIGRVDGLIAKNEKELTEAISDLKRLVKNANGFLNDGSKLFRDGNAKLSNLEHQIRLILQNFEAAGENLNRLIEVVADHPSQLLFGQPPPSRAIEP